MFSGRLVLVIMEAIALRHTPRTPPGDRVFQFLSGLKGKPPRVGYSEL
ncbi:MAG: hypothetical protein ICV55_01370 [Coleofasciculus sp. C3-bin4]|nr:hypothetical protein [Coleofasciculus sp. C3-bin4]